MPPTPYANPAVTEASVTFETTPEKHTVRYIFNTAATKPNLRIPYAVAIDGAVLDEFKAKPKRIPRTDKNNKQEKIEVEAEKGAKVSLYLNSDAHPSYRKNPVYEVTVDEYDIEVTITEKKGKFSDTDTPTAGTKDDKKKLQPYTAPLTGDIWMKVSHKYTADEVEDLVPAGTTDPVKTAVKSIYDGLSEKKLTVTIAATADKPERKIQVAFSDADNPKDNIQSFALLTDGLPRVHPGGYAALFNAAIDAGVDSVTMSSCWRPCLGSIAHRAGLGLDVGYVGNTRMNRQELRDGVDTTNVSAKEKELFAAFEKARAEETAAKTPADAAKKIYDTAKKAEDKALAATKKAETAYSKVQNDAVKGPPAKTKLDAAQKTSDEATKSRKKAETDWQAKEEPYQKAREKREAAEEAWNEERNKNEPETVRKFRESLAASPRVIELFDPWFMDNNTQDKVAATANLQIDGNETLHSHHLHITVKEAKILG